MVTIKNLALKRVFMTFCIFSLINFNTAEAARAVTVVSNPADKAHWTEELAKAAEQISKLQKQIENQMDLINKKALDLMSFGEGDLAGAGRDISDMFKSINSIHDSINALATDYTQTLRQWDDLMPSEKDWKNKSLLEMAQQTAKSRDAWERALAQGLLVTASHDESERTKTQKALNDALRLSKNSKGTVQSIQALSQLNALNASLLQRLENNIAEGNRMRAISDMHRINEEKKREAYVKKDLEAYEEEVDSLKNLQGKYGFRSGKQLTRK